MGVEEEEESKAYFIERKKKIIGIAPNYG